MAGIKKGAPAKSRGASRFNSSFPWGNVFNNGNDEGDDLPWVSPG